MRILLITLYFTPDLGPDPPLMSGLVKSWAKHGHEVTIVSSFPHYKRNKLPGKYKYRLFEYEKNDGCNIIRTWVYVPKKEVIWRRFFNYASFMFFSFLSALISKKHDLVITYAPPPSNGIVGLILSRLWNVPFLYYVQDIYPDVGVQLGLFKNPMLIRIMQKMENIFYDKAKRIIVISNGFKDRLVNKGVPSSKVVVIPNWVDTDFIKPLAKQWKKEFFGKEDVFIFLYSGNVGLTQGLDLILNAAQTVSEKNPDVFFAIVGDGPHFKKLHRYAIEQNIKNVIFRPFVPQKKVPYLLASADISLVVLKKGVALNSVPSKLLSIFASGRPVLASVDAESDTWRIVKKSGAGICVPPEDQDAFVRACDYFYSNRKLLIQFGQNGRKFVEKFFKLNTASEKFIALFKECYNERKFNRKCN